MKPMNLNNLAKRVAEREGGKVNLSIAQIKEVIRLTLEEMTEHDDTIECRSAIVRPFADGTVKVFPL